MLRISKMTDYATVILARLALAPQRQFTAAQLAEQTHLAQPTVSTVSYTHLTLPTILRV